MGMDLHQHCIGSVKHQLSCQRKVKCYRNLQRIIVRHNSDALRLVHIKRNILISRRPQDRIKTFAIIKLNCLDLSLSRKLQGGK